MKKTLLFLSILVFKFNAFSQDIIIPWNTSSGMYKITNSSAYKKLVDINYKTFFEKKEDGDMNLHSVFYFVKIGEETFCNLKVKIMGTDVVIKVVYQDETMQLITLPLREFNKSEDLFIFKSIKDTEQTIVFIRKNSVIFILDIPVTFMGQKLVLHLQPETL